MSKKYDVEKFNQRKRNKRRPHYLTYDGDYADWSRKCEANRRRAVWVRVIFYWIMFMVLAVSVVIIACECVRLNHEAENNLREIERIKA